MPEQMQSVYPVGTARRLPRWRGEPPAAAGWYALYTRARHEKLVDQQLHERGIESFLPLQTELSRGRNRWRWVSRPLFPGYLFVHVARAELRPVGRLRGVVAVVGSAKRPAPVPADQLESVRRMVEPPVRAMPWPYIQSGRAVRVVVGPLAGLRGFIVEPKKTCRLVISVALLGRSVAAEIDARCVAPV